MRVQASCGIPRPALPACSQLAAPKIVNAPRVGCTTNWEPATYSPDTELLYVAEDNGYSIFYLTDVDPRGSMGLGGKEEVQVGTAGASSRRSIIRRGRSPGDVRIMASAVVVDC